MLAPEALGLFLPAAGAVVGSFAATAASRGSAGLSIVRPRSACAGCGRVLGIVDLVPILGYVVRRGQCSACGARISPVYPLTELAGLLLALLSVLLFDGLAIGFAVAFGWITLAIAVRDWTDFTIPDGLSFSLLVLGLVGAGLDDLAILIDHSIAAFGAGVVFLLIAFLYERLRGREGLGLGDAKLIAGIGAWVGIAGVPLVVLIAAVLALAVAALGAWIGGHDLRARDRVPFGTWLCIAAWLALFGAALP